MPEIDDDVLMHYGVMGMKWGRRKTRERKEREKAAAEASAKQKPKVDGKAIGSPIKKMDPTLHASTQDGAHEMAAALKKRYGYEVTEVRSIEQKRAYKNYFAYVEIGENQGTIHIQPRDLNPELQKMAKVGWFGPESGNVRSLMTHETAHSMFHADIQEVAGSGRFIKEYTSPHLASRQKALEASEAQAKADGIKPRHFSKNVSGYANSALYFEETEAEMFSQYHWAKNPPKFIKVWGETLHKEMGVDGTPFWKEVENG